MGVVEVVTSGILEDEGLVGGPTFCIIRTNVRTWIRGQWMMEEGSMPDSVACCMQVGQGNPMTEENDE
jgi:hypothetical protein